MNIKEWLGLQYYISELDQFLTHLNRTQTKLSVSQQQEIEKYTRIFTLRDNPSTHESRDSIWDNF